MATANQQYDYLVVGAGLFGCIFAYEAKRKGRKVIVVDRRPHIGGNCFTRCVEGINVHEYGAHIFRTDDKSIWSYMSTFCEFNNFVNSPIANYKGELFNLPFNMNTFHGMWGVNTPEEAKAVIEKQRIPCDDPTNLEEHILSLVGRDIYEKLVKGYTEKQWGKSCTELPPSIMRRIPIRLTFDNNYFNARYQGIPIGGYTSIFEKMLDGVPVKLGADFIQNRSELEALANRIVYTGAIDEYYDYCFGPLEYRSLRFEHEALEERNHQGVAVMNYTDRETPYTRIIEHKHFERAETPSTVISKEYPFAWSIGCEPYYPLEDAQNQARYEQYKRKSEENPRVLFGGRLGEYKYYDMQDTVKSALLFCKSELDDI